MVQIPYTAQQQVGIARENPAYQNIDTRGLAAAAGMPGAAMQTLARGIGALAEVYNSRQEQSSQFDAERRFQELNGTLDQEYLNLKRAAPPNGEGLPEKAAARFQQHSDAFLANIPAEAQPRYLARLESLKQRYALASIQDKFALQDNFSKTTLNSQFQEHVKGIAADPNSSTDRERAFAELIRSSTLSEVEKEQMARLAVEGFRLARARQDAQDSPEVVAGAVGGIRAALSQRESDNNIRAFNRFGYAGKYQFGAPRLAHLGLYTAGPGEDLGDSWSKTGQREAGKWSGQINIPGFPDVRTVDEFLANGAAQEKAWQIHDAKMTQEAREFASYIGKEHRGIPITLEGIKAGLHLGGVGGVRAFFAGEDRADANRTKVANYIRMGAGVAEAPQRYAGVPVERLEAALNDGLRERAQKETQAQTAFNANAVQQMNDLELRIYQGKAGMTEVMALWDQGLLTSADVLKLQKQVDARDARLVTLQSAQANIQNDQFQWNPLQKEHKDQVNALSEAAGERGLTPQQRMAFDGQIWERTQIASKFLTAELAGSLVSTDPAKIEAAAQIASRMLAWNENAFAGAENAAAIERAAWEYRRLTQDLGLGAKEATARLAGMNDPETRARMAPKGTEVAKFREELTKTDLSSEILRDFQPWFASIRGLPSANSLGMGDQQVAAVENKYKEFMIQHYGEFGNREQARAFAKNKLQQQFGVSQGRLMQYAPEKAAGYPAINGSKNWIYEQAASDVMAATGKPVKPENIVLMPTDGRGGMSTRDAFVNGQPVPYEVKYWTMTPEGFPLMEQLFVPGSTRGMVWVGDAQRADAEFKVKQAEERQRQAQERLDSADRFSFSEAGAPPISRQLNMPIEPGVLVPPARYDREQHRPFSERNADAPDLRDRLVPPARYNRENHRPFSERNKR